MDVPWYVRQQVDAFPDTNWRRPQSAAGWVDPLEKPVISVENILAAADVPPEELTFQNLTLYPLDWSPYVKVEPEGDMPCCCDLFIPKSNEVMFLMVAENDALITQHVDDTLVEFIAPYIGLKESVEMVVYVVYKGMKYKMAGCNILYYLEPIIMGLSPLSATAQGGQFITVKGLQLESWSQQKQMAKVGYNGLFLHTDIVSTATDALVFKAPPMVLNETDVTVAMSVFVTLDTQLWYEVPYKLIYTDQTRFSCDDAISVTSYRALHFTEPKDTLIALPSHKWPHPGSGFGIVATEDANQQVCRAERLWVLRQPHGEPSCQNGVPVLCGSTIRLRNMVTHTNLRSMWGVYSMSSNVRKQEVSHTAETGFGSVEDNWQVVCEPASEHAYDPNWRDLTIDKATHRRQFEFALKEANKYWKRSTVYKLKHVITGRYLNFEELSISKIACGPECSQRDMKLVTAVDSTPKWDIESYDMSAGPAAELDNCIKDMTMSSKTSLEMRHCMANGHSHMKGMMSGVRDGIRFFSMFSDPLAFHHGESSVLMKRFMRNPGRLRKRHMVAWRSASNQPCEGKGSISVGEVHEVFEQNSLLLVERWDCAHFYSERLSCDQTTVRINQTLAMDQVYGPLVVDYPRMTGVLLSVNVTLEFTREKQPPKRHVRSSNVVAAGRP